MLSYSAHFLSQVRHSKLIHLRRFERELFLEFILISQSPENRSRLRSTRRRNAPIYKISRTEITHWMASPFEDCLHFIKTGTYNKNLVSFSLLTHSNRRVKLRWRARVNWPWDQSAVVSGKITSKWSVYFRSVRENTRLTFRECSSTISHWVVTEIWGDLENSPI